LKLIGKYVELQDAYKSIVEALIHAGAMNLCKVKIRWLHSEKITPENVEKKLEGLKGIIVAPGFGHRGIEGKIIATQYVREHNIPFFGICLGMQIAVIEFARNVLGLSSADSTEMNEQTECPVIDLMEEQKGVTEKGGTMRLGAYKCHIVDKESNIYRAYNKLEIKERHRHRYEFNDHYLKSFEAAGMKAVGLNPDTNLVEVIEIPNHKWFVGVQFHPEYSSTVLKPHPLFVAFVKASLGK
jgi:CTP synthase